MILVIGSGSDHVYPEVVRELRQGSRPFAVVDEDIAETYEITIEDGGPAPLVRIRGGGCTGSRRVAAVFVRHAVARTLDPLRLAPLGRLQGALNVALDHVICPVVNPPACAQSNYSKPLQVAMLDAAGFAVPRSLVTNDPSAARRFYEECERKVIFKGVSNVMTLAQVLTDELLPRLELLPTSPTLFQEFIEGTDIRIHVIGEEVIGTRLKSTDEDYRRSLLRGTEDVTVEPMAVPDDLAKRCIAVTHQQGLIVSGIDFKEQSDGTLVALELNPYPQFTFYEGRSGQQITSAVVSYLAAQPQTESNLLV